MSKRRDLGPVVFSAQYQQDPVAPEGKMIRIEWFGTYREPLPRHRFLKVVQSWDTGSTAGPNSDFSVCTTWGFERETYKWHLIDVLRERLEYPDLKRAVIRLWKQHAPDCVLIEKAGSGHSLNADLRAAGRYPLMITPVACKEERFNGCLGEVEAGHLLLPAEAPWLAAFKAELKAFPYGKYDDQVDSFSQFVRFQLKRWAWVLREFAPCGRPIGADRLEHRPW